MTLTDRLLRPALEAALTEARAGLGADPPIPPPPRLRRLLGFTKATGPALHTVRRVVDEDAAFRARVRDATSQEAVGEAGWLWLDRPPNWKVDFARLLEMAEADEADMAADRGLAATQRSLERVEQQLHRALTRVEAVEGSLAEANAELGRERAVRREAEQRAAEAEAALAAATEQRASAVREWKDTERRLAEARSHLRAAAEPSNDSGDADAGGAETPAGPDREAVSDALARAVEAMRGLQDALEVAASLVAGGGASDGDAEPAAVIEARPAGGRAGRSARSRRRQPSGLPPGRFDDDPAVVEHLARLPGALLLVDGYNVTKTAWPEAPVPEQRDRLLAALEALHARTGAEAVVVFDGVDSTGPASGRRGSGAIRVRFTPGDVEADDVVLELAADVPLRRPVIVVSSDNRVREGARALGANLVSAAQFLAAPVLGRSQSA